MEVFALDPHSFILVRSTKWGTRNTTFPFAITLLYNPIPIPMLLLFTSEMFV